MRNDFTGTPKPPATFHEHDSLVHPSFKGGKVDLQTYVTNWDDCDELQAVINAWYGEVEVGIACHFSLTSILEKAIRMNAMPAHDGALNEESKPMFDAMRAELVAMIGRIDALKFAARHHRWEGDVLYLKGRL